MLNCSMAIAEGLAFLLVFQYIEYRGMPAVAYQRNGQASTWSYAAVKLLFARPCYRQCK